jgi:GNAT superfamily N-acetyltransferase
MLKIHPVETKDSLKQFIKYPWQLYKDYPNWIAPLKYELTKRINPKKNSFFRRGAGRFFLAKRDGKVVGRISVSIDPGNMKKPGGREGNFGCYESIDDPEVAKVLVGAGLDWLKGNKVSKVMGPVHFRLEDPYPGFLVEGHQHKPYFMMTYSMPYYSKLMEQLGFSKVMDLYSYEVSKEVPLPEEFSNKAKEAAKIPNLKLRNINMKKLYEEAQTIGDIFNEALSGNWGHVAFTKRHVRRMAKDLKLLADPRIIFIAEVDGRAVGAVINLPNYNDILGDLNGSLFPRGILRVLFQKKRIKSLRGYAMAVRNEFQGSGLGCLMTEESFKAGITAGYERGEITWILGSNSSMNKLAEFMGGNRSKAYRLYQMNL